MTGEVRLRAASAEDLEALVELDRLGGRRDHAQWAQELERAFAWVWVAERAGAVIGLSVSWAWAPSVELHDIVVAPAARRLGVGRQLMAALRARARAEGLEHVHLEVRPSNAAALALYRAMGFTEQGRRRRYYADGEDALLLSWAVD